jgi:plasmid stabilization system protein ParE
VGAYFVFYRLVKDGTEIVRILHGRRNLKAAFRDRKH